MKQINKLEEKVSWAGQLTPLIILLLTFFFTALPERKFFIFTHYFDPFQLSDNNNSSYCIQEFTSKCTAKHSKLLLCYNSDKTAYWRQNVLKSSFRTFEATNQNCFAQKTFHSCYKLFSALSGTFGIPFTCYRYTTFSNQSQTNSIVGRSQYRKRLCLITV